MLIYVLIFIIAFVFLLNENTNNSQRYVRFLFIIIFVIMGLRDYSVGTDTITYIQQYEDGSSYLRSADVVVILSGYVSVVKRNACSNEFLLKKNSKSSSESTKMKYHKEKGSCHCINGCSRVEKRKKSLKFYPKTLH